MPNPNFNCHKVDWLVETSLLSKSILPTSEKNVYWDTCAAQSLSQSYFYAFPGSDNGSSYYKIKQLRPIEIARDYLIKTIANRRMSVQ